MREDMLAEERKPWQDTRNRVEEDADDDGRPPPCVGICYYNKLMALEAKEDLTKHNMVYKQANEEEAPNEELEENESDSNIIVIDDDAQSEHFGANSDKPEATDTIYIDDTP